MTATGLVESMTKASTAEGRRRRIRWPLWLLGISGMLVLVSIVRLITASAGFPHISRAMSKFMTSPS